MVHSCSIFDESMHITMPRRRVLTKQHFFEVTWTPWRARARWKECEVSTGEKMVTVDLEIFYGGVKRNQHAKRVKIFKAMPTLYRNHAYSCPLLIIYYQQIIKISVAIV